jgi:lysophospholipase L1-like esterase
VDSVTETGLTIVSTGTKLARRFVSGFTARKVSDNSLMGNGTDYMLEPNSGTIISNIGSIAVNLAYSASKMRYDAIGYDPVAHAVHLESGTPRDLDPREYAPNLPAGVIPLFDVFFYNHTVELLNTFAYRGFVRYGDEGAHAAWLKYCRAALADIITKMKAGLSIVSATYGTSIDAAGGTATIAENTDGDSIPAFYGLAYPSDTLALFPNHTEGGIPRADVSYTHVIRDFVQARFGSTLTLHNFGVNGSNTGTSGSNPVGMMNTTRLSNLFSVSPELVFLVFGMNDLGGGASLTTNIESFITYSRAHGAEPLVFTVPPFNAYCTDANPSFPSFAVWKATNDAIKQAAINQGAAYVETTKLFYTGNEGASRMSQKTMGAVGWFNHAGIAERQVMGQYARLIFDPTT